MRNNLADKIFIDQLKVPAQVGILPEEKALAQVVVIDCAFSIDAKKAALFDRLEDTVDYAVVRQNMIDFLAEHRFQLLETLADRLANFLIKQHSLCWIQLSVKKPAIFSDAKGVSVMIERTNDTATVV